MPRRFLLVDTIPHGHHPRFLRLYAEALSTVAPVSLLLSPALAEAAGYDSDAFAAIGRELSARQLLVAASEHAQDIGANHIIYLYGARSLIVAWLTSRRFPVPASTVVFSPPNLHYPRAYQSPITAAERIGATIKEAMFKIWRRRKDAHSVWTLDPAVSDRWNRSAGARAVTLEQPPVAGMLAANRPTRIPPDERPYDCVVYGAISPRKGLTLLADGLQHGPELRILIAGSVLPADRPSFADDIAAIRRSGSTVTVREGWVDDADVAQLLASARCVLLAYPRHRGDSWVLLEAAAAGVPVIAHRWGLLGHTVRANGLGLTVDCTDPGALGTALGRIREPDFDRDHADRLSAFVANHRIEVFTRSVTAPFQDANLPLRGSAEPKAQSRAS